MGSPRTTTNSTHSPQLDKARTQQRRPTTAKTQNKWKRTDSVSQDGNSKKEQKINSRGKNTAKKRKNVFDGLMNKPDTVKLSIQIFRQNPPKLKGKENKGWKKKEKGREHPWDNHKGYSIHIMGIPEAEDREGKRRNTWHDKCQKAHIMAYHFQITENQR